MKIIILGSTGYVGNQLFKHLSKSYDVITAARNRQANIQIDIGSEKSLESLQQFISSLDESVIIINCIAKAELESCEIYPDESKHTNYSFVKKLVCISNRTEACLIHVSSNAVYDGEYPPYKETDELKPINTYGRHKAAADKYIINNSNKYCILRPITIYGPKMLDDRPNPVSFIINKLNAGQKIKLVDDNYTNMIHIHDFCKCVESAIQKSSAGVFNLSGDGVLNRYELGIKIAEICGLNKELISEVKGSEFSLKAKRPVNTSFDNYLMKSELNIIPSDFEREIGIIYKNKKY